ncbi:MAG: ribonuclease [Lachnospiraceae bacterium]|nr:ribonuclease [Lachnospiraceae bacterium]
MFAFLVTGCKKKAKEEVTSTKVATEQETTKVQAISEKSTKAQAISEKSTKSSIDKDGSYYSKDEVALYIHTYGKLPSNFITKTEAKALGWEGGSVEKYAKGKVIGGDRFGNYEGKLPSKKGRTYTECDIDTYKKSSRGAKRIIFSNDGLVYYTEDHYETFTLLYGEVN